MNEIKPTLASKTFISGIIVAAAGALGLGGVIDANIANAVVTLGGLAVMLFRKKATARLG